MNDEIYRGESQTIVFRCHDGNQNPVDMTGKNVIVVMADRRNKVVFEYTTEDKGKWKVEVEGNFIFCKVSYIDMQRLKGIYMIEIRVKENDIVQIAQVPGNQVLDSITGSKS